MTKRKPKQQAVPRHESITGDEWRALVEGVRAALPEARALLFQGLDYNDSGVEGIVEGWLERDGTEKKAESVMRSNGGNNTDGLFDIKVAASRAGFMLGVAYGLLVNRDMFLNGRVR